VVFDRNGTVISRYRKYNLFGESVDKPFKPSMETFETDFGVKFGHFICFDLMFRYPALEMVRNHNLTDIVFTTMWFSELPYLTAVQAQQNWAHSNNVNLLASGANNVGVGSTGSGIFGGKKGAYVSDMAGVSKTQLYTATVYKIKDFPQNENVRIEHSVVSYTKEQMKDLKLKRDQLDAYDMDFLDDTDGAHYKEKNICKEGLCCNIKVNYTVSNSQRIEHYQYALAFYHGNRTFDGFADGGVVVCTVLACQQKNISTCGIRNEELENIHIWDAIHIETELPTKDGQFFYMPTSLDTSIMSLQPESFDYVRTDLGNDKTKIVMKLNSHAVNLITFGVYGRDFNLDENGGSTQSASIVLLISLLISFLVVAEIL
jgi:pantetheine hydrolase